MTSDPLDIHTLPGHLIRRLHQISVAQFMDQMAAEGVDLTPVQFSAMAAIRRHPGIDQASVAGLIAYDRATLGKVVDRLVEKGKLTADQGAGMLGRITPCSELAALASARLLVEAIVESLDVKRQVFSELEALVADDAVLATNTSSISITAIGAESP